MRKRISEFVLTQSVFMIGNDPVNSNHRDCYYEVKFQTFAGVLLARWVFMVDLECCCLNSNTLLHTYICIYIYTSYVTVI